MNRFRRVATLLTRPREAWQRIAAEREDASILYPTYVAPLAAIPSLAMLTGMVLSGGRFLGAAGIAQSVTAAGMTYAIALATPFFAALCVEQVATRFKSDGSDSRMFRLVAYASTPMWLAGVCYVLVQLWPLVMAGSIYGVYLLYVGCAIVTETPGEQRVPLTLVIVIAVMFVNITLRWIAQRAGIPTYGF